MTLNATATAITIKNSAGVSKFDHTSRLAYRSFYQTGGGVNFSGGANILVNLTSQLSVDFYILNFKITFTQGNALTGLTNIWIPGNGTVNAHFYGRGVNNVPSADTDYISAALVNNNTAIVFSPTRINYVNGGSPARSPLVTYMSYKLSGYKFL